MPTDSGNLATQAHQTGADILAQLQEAVTSNKVAALDTATRDAITEIQSIVSDFQRRFPKEGTDTAAAQFARQQEIDRIRASISK